MESTARISAVSIVLHGLHFGQNTTRSRGVARRQHGSGEMHMRISGEIRVAERLEPWSSLHHNKVVVLLKVIGSVAVSGLCCRWYISRETHWHIGPSWISFSPFPVFFSLFFPCLVFVLFYPSFCMAQQTRRTCKCMYVDEVG